MACEERDRLTKIYISPIAENNDSAGARAGKASWSDTWREKVRGMRESYRCWKKQAGPSIQFNWMPHRKVSDAFPSAPN